MTYEELLDKWIRKLGRDCTAGEIVHDLRQLEQPVRCKDCKFGITDGAKYFCRIDGGIWCDGDWFCANGERREDEVLRMPPADGSTIPAAYLVNCESCLQVTERPGNDICKDCGGRRGQDASRVEKDDLCDMRE